MTKKRVFILTLFLFGLLVGIIGWNFYRRWTAKDEISGQTGLFSSKIKETPKAIEPLTGEKVDQQKANRTPIAVIIENHTQARPQAGLDQASVVFEAIAEGGITRFLALFGPNEPEKIGPVRSARTYFVNFAREYKAPLAHVGGNIDALDLIQEVKSRDLDQFRYGLKAYWREPQPGKATEHTMFASVAKLRGLAKENGWDDGASYDKLKFKNDSPSASPTNQTLTIEFGGADYQAKWTYQPQNNDYLRTIGGVSYVAKNIIIQEVARQVSVTRINENGFEFTTTGSGKAKIIRDGTAVEGNWKKTAADKRTKFFDKDGGEIEFNRGVTWYEITHPDIGVKIE